MSGPYQLGAPKAGAYVAYFRVSTARQGRSGLGLEAQRDVVLTFLNGGRWELKAEFTEIESGANSERPELAKALAACRVYQATLLVAKLDRLSRDARFLLNLKAGGVRFVVAEMPEANELTIDLLAVLAQHERRLISERTRAALAAAKRRGVKLGGTADRIPRAAARRGVQASAALRTAKATELAQAFAPTIRELQARGIVSPSALAIALNDRGMPAPRGGQWRDVQVRRLLARLAAV